MHHVCPYCDLYFQAQGIFQNFRYAGVKKGTETKTYAIRTSDAKWFAAHRKELEERYSGEHIFVFNKEVFHDEHEDKARDALIKKYPEALVKKFEFGNGRSGYEGKWIHDHSRAETELRKISN